MSTWPDGLVDLRPARKFSLYANIAQYGAVGDGVTDDTTAIDLAFAANGGQIFVPWGNFLYNGTGYAGDSPSVVGLDRSKSNITLGAGKSLITRAATLVHLTMRDLTITGGYGAIRHSFTGVNVQKPLVVQRCNFEGYTGAAISTLVSDGPFWMLHQCRFFAANDTTAMGFVHMGLADMCIIDGCEFDRNRIHIKFGQAANNAYITKTGFVHWNPTCPNERINIWVMPNSSPTNSGQGMGARDCKMGTENDLSTDYKIVYADEDTSVGTDSSNRFPKLATASAGYVTGHEMTAIAASWGASPPGPLIFSTTPNLNGNVWCGTLAGTPPTDYLRYLNPPTADRLYGNNKLEWIASLTAGIDELSPIPCRSDTAGVVNDPMQTAVYDRALQLPGGGDRAGYASLMPTLINSFTLGGGATKSAVADALGGTDAAEVVFSSGSLCYSAINTPTLHLPTWIEFDAKQGASSPAPYLAVTMQYTSNGAMHYRRFFNLLTTWRRYRFLWSPREATTTNLLIFSVLAGYTMGKVDIGRVRVYQAYEPQAFQHAYATAARPSATILGDGYQVYDATLNKPIWSDGSVWRDATGTAV